MALDNSPYSRTIYTATTFVSVSVISTSMEDGMFLSMGVAEVNGFVEKGTRQINARGVGTGVCSNAFVPRSHSRTDKLSSLHMQKTRPVSGSNPALSTLCSDSGDFVTNWAVGEARWGSIRCGACYGSNLLQELVSKQEG